MSFVVRAKLVGGAAAALALVLLAGCGSIPAGRSRTAVAAGVLDSATSSVLSTSFRADFTGSARLTLAGLSGLPASSRRQLTELARGLNSSTLTGWLEFQSPSDYEASYRFAPALPAPVDVREVAGMEYLSLNGTTWNRVVPASIHGGLPGSWASMPEALKSLAKAVKGATAVSNLGPTDLNGKAVNHIEATISGTRLERILAGALARAPQEGAGAGLQGLAELVNLNPLHLDFYISRSTRLPVQESVNGGMSLNLAALGLLGSSALSGAQGSVTLTVDMSVTFSGYGSHFAITKPTHVLPGPPANPSAAGLSSLF